MTKSPPRGFSLSEYENRTERAQTLMRAAELDALLLMTEPEVRYFSGFQSQFWHSPTRPWFLVIPATGKPIAVIPAIGAVGFGQTWIEDIRTWPAPQPADDGISLLSTTLREVASRYRAIGLPMGHESQLRMPLNDFFTLQATLTGIDIRDARGLVRQLRVIKSAAEIDKIRHICQLTSRAFADLASMIEPGQTERQVCQRFRQLLLEYGADDCPYVMGASGPGSYADIITGPGDRRLHRGDIMIIDTGAIFDGYFCDFDRNFAITEVSSAARNAYECVYAATDAGFDAARPGNTTSEVWTAMWQVLAAGGARDNNVGRLGHGLGMQLTEWPSNMPGDDTVLQTGMVITLEPGMEFAPGQLMVHEENIVIRDSGAEWLTRRAAPQITLVGGPGGE